MSSPAQFLVGEWRNQLGATLEIISATGVGVLGVYRAPGSDGIPLSGTFNAAEPEGGSLAFSVNGCHFTEAGETARSTTGWCGLARGRIIEAQWLVARYGEPARDGESTSTGRDVFTKV
jgi:hypothetical protein